MGEDGGQIRRALLEVHICSLLAPAVWEVEQGPSAAPIHHLSEFTGKGGAIEAQPGDLVFREKPSRLVGPDGKSVTW